MKDKNVNHINNFAHSFIAIIIIFNPPILLCFSIYLTWACQVPIEGHLYTLKNGVREMAMEREEWISRQMNRNAYEWKYPLVWAFLSFFNQFKSVCHSPTEHIIFLLGIIILYERSYTQCFITNVNTHGIVIEFFYRYSYDTLYIDLKAL